ncbi:MAG: ATP-dependent zinc metalloprotease FtsH [Planctomycetota bacterium]|nr:ATP-dependent zinc metalloprotease FtsH [Planctomycetota bacterium]
MPEPTPDKPDRPTPPPQQPPRFGGSMMAWVILIMLCLLAANFLADKMGEARREIRTTDFWTYVENGNLKGDIVIYRDRIDGENARATTNVKESELKFRLSYNYTAENDFDQRLRKMLKEANCTASPKYPPPNMWEAPLMQLGVTLVVLALIWFLLFRRLGGGGGGGGFLGSFGRSRHRVATRERTTVRFDDVAGIEEAKEEVREIIEFLKNPRKFQRLGGRIPRGVLLVGEPGCGKTLMAKAIAGEAEVPFFSISGSDFVEMFVGVGASRVRDLFREAKDSAPCIIFLDEIDAVGRRRSGGDYQGGGQETAQTLNAILVEMDGFNSSDQVIVIAATNRLDVLDPALTRPGRFDRQINVPLPDLKGRYEILKIYATKVKCGPDVDLNRLARGTPMFSGADLAALVNEAAISATMADKNSVEQADLEEARDKVRWGRARKSRVIDEHEKEITAYHEAGHALVQILSPNADPLHKVSIIPRGQMGGATFSLPEKDRYIWTRAYCTAQLCVCMGGRVAEEVFCHDLSSGAQGDIAQATAIARKMVLDWGMSARVGLVNYSRDEQRSMAIDLGGKDYSDRTAEIIDEEIRGIIDAAHAAAKGLIEANAAKLESLTRALIKYETLDAQDVQRILDGQTLDKPTVADLIEAEHAKNPLGLPGAGA